MCQISPTLLRCRAALAAFCVPMHYVPKHRLLRFIKTEHNQLMGWVTKLLYDTYNQPNVEILLGQRSEIEKIVDPGEEKASFLSDSHNTPSGNRRYLENHQS